MSMQPSSNSFDAVQASAIFYDKYHQFEDSITFEPIVEAWMDKQGHNFDKNTIAELMKQYRQQNPNDLRVGFICPYARDFVKLKQLSRNLALDSLHDDVKKSEFERMAEQISYKQLLDEKIAEQISHKQSLDKATENMIANANELKEEIKKLKKKNEDDAVTAQKTSAICCLTGIAVGSIATAVAFKYDIFPKTNLNKMVSK